MDDEENIEELETSELPEAVDVEVTEGEVQEPVVEEEEDFYVNLAEDMDDTIPLV